MEFSQNSFEIDNFDDSKEHELLQYSDRKNEISIKKDRSQNDSSIFQNP